MDQRADIEVLQLIADYRKVCKTLATAAKGSIIGGILNAAHGVMHLQWGAINIVVVLIGLFMIVEGAWNLLRPTAAGIILDGVVFLIVGAWNILITILVSVRGFPPPIQWAILGVFMVGFAIYRFVSYRHFSKVFSQTPSQEDLDDMDDLVNHIRETNAVNTENMVEFEQKSFLWHQFWKCQLGTKAAIFVSRPGPESHSKPEVLVAPRDAVDFTIRRKLLLGKRLKASLRIRKRKMKVLISPQFSNRLEAWKTSDSGLA